MKHFELNLEEEINIYINSGLTPTELFIIRLLFLAQDGALQYLSNYLSNTSGGKELFVAVLKSLKDKKVINSTMEINLGMEIDYRNIPINKNFIKSYVKESHELGKELFEEYPMFMNIGGKLCSIRNFTKAGFFDLKDFCIFYAKSIKNSGVTHERIMEALRFGKENNLINYTILEFLASKKYLEIEYLQTSGNINGYNNTELI